MTQHKIDGKKLYSWYRHDLQMSLEAACACMPTLDYSLPVEFREVPAPGLAYVVQGKFSAIVPCHTLFTVCIEKR